MSTARGARLAVVAGATLWGTTGTAQALGPTASTPAVVGTLRILLGALVLLVAAAVGGSLRQPWWAPGRRVATLVGMVSIAAYQVCFFAGVDRAGVAVGTVVGIGSAPVTTGLLGLLLRRERPEPGWTTATALAVAGAALLVGAGSGGGAVDPLGVLLAVAAGAAYAAYVLAGKALLDRGAPPTATMAVLFSGGAVLLAPLLATPLLAGELAWLATPRGLGMAAWLGVVTAGVAYVLYARGLRGLPPASVATYTLAEPLTAALLGVVVLGERPGAAAVVGALLVVSGLLLLSLRPLLASRPAAADR